MELNPNFDFNGMEPDREGNGADLKSNNEENSNEYQNPIFVSYSDAVIDLSQNVPDPVPVLTLHGSVIFTQGNVSVISGQAKSRKTFLIVLLVAEFFKANPDGKIVLADTEMSKSSTHKTAKRIHRLMGWDTKKNHERLIVLNLREYDHFQRLVAIKGAVDNIKPELIFIDGVRDLVTDINNVAESVGMVEDLMKLSSALSCHICSVLHENKAMKGHQAMLRGHLGTELINKSETVISVSTVDNITTVRPEYSRNPEFETFYIRINEEGLPEHCDASLLSAKKDMLLEVLTTVMKRGTPMKCRDLITALIKKVDKDKRSIERWLKEARELGVLEWRKGGYYTLPAIQQEVEDSTTPN